jgi:flagellar biosynthetic protein FliP
MSRLLSPGSRALGVLITVAAGLVFASPALAQAQATGPALGDGAAARIGQTFVLVAALSLAPILMVSLTSFTRFLIAFSFLRSGLGLQGAPANLVLIALSLFMTAYVMAPVADVAWRDGIAPYMEGKINEKQAYDAASKPLRAFMLGQTRDRDLALFSDLASETLKVKTGQEADLRVLAPAFLISEIRRGFEIGFLIVLPFLVIDLVVAIVVMSMGMMMMPPAVLSLPLKVLFFVLIDGWSLLAGSLIRSYS